MFPLLQGTKISKYFQCRKNCIEAYFRNSFPHWTWKHFCCNQSVTLVLKVSLLWWDFYPQSETTKIYFCHWRTVWSYRTCDKATWICPLPYGWTFPEGGRQSPHCEGHGALVLSALPSSPAHQFGSWFGTLTTISHPGEGGKISNCRTAKGAASSPKHKLFGL